MLFGFRQGRRENFRGYLTPPPWRSLVTRSLREHYRCVWQDGVSAWKETAYWRGGAAPRRELFKETGRLCSGSKRQRGRFV